MIQTPASSKLLLVADRPAGGAGSGVSLRRFRLARLRIEGRPEASSGRPPLTEHR